MPREPVWAGFLGGVAAMCTFLLLVAVYEAIRGSRDGDVYGKSESRRTGKDLGL